MKIDYMKLASAVNAPVRLAMGFGVGLFIRKSALMISEKEGDLGKVVTWLGAFCVAFGIGHAIDCWCNEVIETCCENQKLQDLTLNTEE